MPKPVKPVEWSFVCYWLFIYAYSKSCLSLTKGSSDFSLSFSKPSPTVLMAFRPSPRGLEVLKMSRFYEIRNNRKIKLLID